MNYCVYIYYPYYCENDEKSMHDKRMYMNIPSRKNLNLKGVS